MEVLVGLALGSIGLAVWGIRRFMNSGDSPRNRARRLLAKLTRARVADLHTGRECAVVGTVLPANDPLISPVTGTECIAWEVRVWAVGEGASKIVAAKARVMPFSLEDDSGTVLVRPKWAVPLLSEFESHGFKGNPPDGVIEALGKGPLPFSIPRGYCEEAVLVAGETVVVGGVAAVEIDPSSVTTDYRTAPTRAVLRSTKKVPISVSNDPKLIR